MFSQIYSPIRIIIYHAGRPVTSAGIKKAALPSMVWKLSVFGKLRIMAQWRAVFDRIEPIYIT